MLSNITLMNLTASLQRDEHLVPSELWKEFIGSLEALLGTLNHINESTTLMRLLRDLRSDAQPQKIIPDIDFIPIIERYRHQGIHFLFHFSEKSVLGGKEEFKSILELLLSNLLERREIIMANITLEISDTHIRLSLEGNMELFNDIGSMTRSEAYQHRIETLSIIRMHLVRKLVEKWKGSITFTKRTMQIVMPVRVWEKRSRKS